MTVATINEAALAAYKTCPCICGWVNLDGNPRDPNPHSGRCCAKHHEALDRLAAYARQACGGTIEVDK